MKRGEKGKWKPGESGNPAGRPKGSGNRDAIRERLFDVLEDRLTVKELTALIKQLEPRDQVNMMLKMLEFLIPRYRSVEATIEQPGQDKPSIELGRLTKEQRKTWYELYDLAKIKPNGQEDVDQVKTQDHG